MSPFDAQKRETPATSDLKKLRRGPVKSPLESDEQFSRRIAADKINKMLFHTHNRQFEIFKSFRRETRADIFFKALEAELQNKTGVEVWLSEISAHNKNILDFK